jgi:hypothetical protein
MQVEAGELDREPVQPRLRAREAGGAAANAGSTLATSVVGRRFCRPLRLGRGGGGRHAPALPRNRYLQQSYPGIAFYGTSSVADPGCLSRITDPDVYSSRIPDLGSRIQKQQQKRGVKKLVVIPFFVALNFTKLKIILFLKC